MLMLRWLALAAALLCLRLEPSAAAELVKLRYGQAYSAVHTIFALPVAVAQSEGLFRREGIDFQLVIPIPGGSDKMIAALHDDTVDVTHVATPFLVRAALAGSDGVAIAAEFNSPVYSLVAQPQIARFSDLRGKLIGMADEGGTISFSIRKLLARHGLSAGDFRTKVIEGTPARLSCLQRGECAAVPLGQPDDFTAAAKGYRVLGSSTEAMPDFVYTVTAARKSWAEANKDAVTRYVRALASAFEFIHDPANRAAVVRITMTLTGCSEASARATLALYLDPDRNVLPRRGELSLDGLGRVISFMAETGAIKGQLPSPGNFVDLRYLQAAGIK